MQISNNPLKQYFRRPAIYLRLPSGGVFYTPDTVEMPENNELPVYPMTAIDDITAKTPDALYNGQAVVDIIKSCVPNIKNPWKLNSIDLDSVLIAIKSASTAEGIDINTVCPACGESTEFKLNLVGILNTMRPPNYADPLQVGELKILFKPLTYKELNDVSTAQFEMQRLYANLENITDVNERTSRSTDALKMITQVTMETLTKTIKSITLPSGEEVTDFNFILEFMKGCDKMVFELIKDHTTKLKEESSLKPMPIKCMHCQHEYEQGITLNMTDFFG